MNAAENAGWSRDWEGLARRLLGDGLFEGLVQAMLDSATAPSDLAHAKGPSLVAVRDESAMRLREGLESVPRQVLAELAATLPWHLEGVPFSAAVLRLGTHRAYFSLPDAIYDARPPVSRVLGCVPDLAHALDDDGLLDALTPRTEASLLGAGLSTTTSSSAGGSPGMSTTPSCEP